MVTELSPKPGPNGHYSVFLSWAFDGTDVIVTSVSVMSPVKTTWV